MHRTIVKTRSWSLINFNIFLFSLFWKLNTWTFISNKLNIFLILSGAWSIFNLFVLNSWLFSWQYYSFLNIINKIFFGSICSWTWSNIYFFLNKSWLIQFQRRSWSIFNEIKVFILLIMTRSWSHFNDFLLWLPRK